MEEIEEANFIAGRGIEGDRYFLGTGTYSRKPDVREVTLFEMEVLEALARNDPPLQIGPSSWNRPTIAATSLWLVFHSIIWSAAVSASATAYSSAAGSIFPADTLRNFSLCRFICRCTTGPDSIAGSRKVAPSAAAIRSSRSAIRQS